MKNILENKTQFFVSLFTSSYFLYYLYTYKEWHFLDNVNLIIHEAGHVIFMFFGEFFHILGGSLFQMLFPSLFVLYFYRKQNYFSASLLLFWVGQNIVNVSVYASDALNMELPLLGGDLSGHDWNNLLQMTNTLEYTNTIGTSIFYLGVITIFCAVYFSFKTHKKSL